MSITCSIPGCNKRTSLSDETKLYRVPAVAIGSSESSGLIYSLTNERRIKWFEVLETCGLKEDNAASYRVCSNHFKDGKPSPIFDNKSIDWAPSINLPSSESVIQEVMEVQDIKEKRRRGRQNKRDIIRSNSIERNGQLRSKSVERAKSGRNKNSYTRSKSVCRSKFFENEISLEKKSSDQPFVFVDIQKIKEGPPTPFTDMTPRPKSSEGNKFNVEISSENDSSKSFNAQTNTNILLPLNCDINKSEKQHDTHYETSSVQTDPVSMLELSGLDNSSVQASLGEMIEFVRMQILDYNLKALGSSFKIKECALHFQKEGDEVNKIEEEANTVVVHPTRLLSSNWKLLEAVAISLDLNRVQDKNVKSCYSRTLNGKTETIEKISNDFEGNESWRNQLKEIDKSNEYALGDIADVNDDENGNNTRTESPMCATNKDVSISPVLPRITSVISIGELLKDTTPSKSSGKQNTARKKSESHASVTRTTPRRSSLVRKKSVGKGTSVINLSRCKRKIPYIKNMRRKRLEKNTVLQGILGTSKVPRVVLSKLPDTVFQNGGRVPLRSAPKYSHRNSCTIKSRSKVRTTDNSPEVWLPDFLSVRNSSTNISPTSEMKNRSLSFKSVKNIPLKLSQSSDVAGYLLVPDVSSMGGKAPLMYVPKPNADDNYPKTNYFNKNNLDELRDETDGITNTVNEVIQDNIAQLSSPRGGSSFIRGVHVSKITKVTEPKLTKVADSKTSKLPRKRGPAKKIKVSRRRKQIFDEINMESLSKDNVGDKLVDSHIEKGIPNVGEALLRCPYCLKNCKDGLDFINHHKTTTCKGKKKCVPRKEHDSKRRTGAESFHDCNVCGKVFVKESQLDIHLQMHVEYEVWDEKCAECPKKFATTEELQDHISERHSWKIKIAKFECPECEKRFTTRKRLECHIEKKHPPTNNKRCNIRIRCKFCRKIFDLEHYRQVHWRECQEKKEEEDYKELLGLSNGNNLEEETSVNDKVKITKAHRDIKVKVTRRNSNDNLISGYQKMEHSEIIEEQKKPTAIRTIKKDHSNDELEAQLSRMFEEDSSEDSSPSEYEQEELLEEGYEDELSSQKNKIGCQFKVKKRKKSISEEDFEQLPIKISKMDEEIEKSENELLTSSLVIASGMNDQPKIDIKSLLNVDDSTNDIVIEEIEDNEYFSMDESTHEV